MIWILTPVHNPGVELANFSLMLNHQTFQDFFWVIVENRSTVFEYSELERRPDFVISAAKDVWWAGALKLGFEFFQSKHISHDDLILILNVDVFFGINYICDLLKEYHELVIPSILGTSYYEGDSVELVPAGVYFDFLKFLAKPTWDSRATNCVSTRGLISAYGILNHGLPFYPNFLPHYYSDYYYSLKLHELGIQIQSSHKATLKTIPEISGLRNFQYIKLRTYLNNIFSKRNVNNPFYMFTFLILTYRFHKNPKLYFIVFKKIYFYLKNINKYVNL